MTSWRALLIAIVVVAAVAPSLAVNYTVGDGAGWALNNSVNYYTDWANGKDFQVGDYLTFLYTPGNHNVLEVSRDDSEGCTSSDAAAIPYMSGRDAILLDIPGEKWYICDISNHCLQGMKLGINVSAAAQGLPPPTAVIGSSPAGELRSCGALLLVMAAYRIIMA